MLKNPRSVLGMNARSRIYLRANKKKARSLADDKLGTKQVLMKHGIATADLIAVISDRNQLNEFDWDRLPSSFVIKPNKGLGGEGIQVVFNRLKNGNWLTTNKRELDGDDFYAHISNILDGNFSLMHTPDQAIIESRLSTSSLYKQFGAYGIPDIRVIVYNNVPVMAMLRVPTKKSGGKANLAQGGIGIGIDITSGFTTHAVQKSFWFEKEVDRHPDTNVKLRGIRLPYWDNILKTAVLAARVTGLKYCGVDISVDKKRGPVVLELNARPGLGIQTANMAPLRDRLRRIRGLKVKTPERGLGIAKELFSGQLEEAVSTVTGRDVIGLVEPVRLYGKDDIVKTVRAKIDTGADDSSIDIALAKELGFEDAVTLFQSQPIPEHMDYQEASALAKQIGPELMQRNSDITRLSVVKSSHGVSIRMHVKLKLSMAGYKYSIEPNIFDRSHLKYPILVGRRNLSQFLIDTTKRPIKKVSKKK